MSELLPFIILGIATGSLYGLAGTGLVLTYKTSGIFNFGYGAIAAAAAYLFYFLYVEQGIGWVPAMLISVVGLGTLVGLLFELGASRLAKRSTSLKIVATIGIVLVVQGLATIIWGPGTLALPDFLPGAGEAVTIAGARVTVEQLILTGVAVVTVLVFYALFRWSRTGLAMRAVVDDPDLLSMQATNPTGVRRVSWIVGSNFAALSGVLIASLTGIESILLTYLVVQAFGAAAVGAFSSIPLTFLGGVGIGIASAISTKYVVDVPWLAGLPASLPFIVLFAALLIVPRRKLVPLAQHPVRPRITYVAPARLRVGLAVVVVAALLAVPQLVGGDLAFYTEALVTAILLLSLGLLVRISGQVSLCHATLAAVGAVAFSQFSVDLGIPWVGALLLGGLVTMVVGALVAIPAIRLSGLFLALATLGFGILVERLLYGQSWMFTTFAQGLEMPRPGFAESAESYYYVVLAVLVLSAGLVVAIQQSRLGRMLQGMSGSPTAVSAMGLGVNTTKVLVFCISAFLAGVAGALIGVERGFAVSGDTFFGSFYSLVLLAMLAIAPFGVPWFALVALVGVLPAYLTGEDTTIWLNVMFGTAAVLVSMQGGSPGTPPALQRLLDRLGGRRPVVDEPPPSPAPTAAELRPAAATRADRGPGLAVEGLTVRFGGLTAVADLSLEAPLGQITGLVGPNGAGKTTTFDVCSGFTRATAGKVAIHGRDVTRVAPAGRARRGLGRTFQRVEICETLSVLQNVMLGREAGVVGGSLGAHLLARPGEPKAAEEAAWEALHLCGIGHLAHVQGGALSTGQARLVEVARLLAGSFDVLLLDEPSSGLDEAETARLGQLLERIAAERGVGILIVEHDIELVMRICDGIYVLDFGKLICKGEPTAVAESPAVRAAYLGEDPEAAASAPAGER